MGTIRRVDFSPDEFLTGVQGMSAAEIGFYWVTCSLIYSRGGPIDNDPARLAKIAGCKMRTARKYIATLIASGKLKQQPDGRLANGRAAVELQAATKRIGDARRAAQSRWARPKRGPNAAQTTEGFGRNQRVSDATRNANHQRYEYKTHDSESSVAAREAELSPTARPARDAEPAAHDTPQEAPPPSGAELVRRAARVLRAPGEPPPGVGRPDLADVEAQIRGLGVDPATVEAPPPPTLAASPSIERPSTADVLANAAVAARKRFMGGR